MRSKLKEVAGLTSVGIGMAIGRWLIPPEAMTYGIRFWFVMAAIALWLAGFTILFLPNSEQYGGLSATRVYK